MFWKNDALFGVSARPRQLHGVQYAEKLENAALFLRLGLPFTLIQHEMENAPQTVRNVWISRCLIYYVKHQNFIEDDMEKACE